MATLRDKQVASIKRILNLNAPTADPNAEDASEPASTDGPAWKILVFDNQGRDVVSSVLRVADLRKQGVTMHLHVQAKRQPVPDTPVIYLMEPTAENLRIVTSDLSKGLYNPAFVNFLSSVPRPMLEDFAADAVAADCAESIAAIHDQYLGFISTEADLFHLNIPSAYHRLNSSQTSDNDIDSLVDQIVTGLFGVILTMEVVPIIRCPKGGPAADVAAKLDRRLRDFVVSSGKNLSSTTSRPLLILADRSIDFTVMLSHSWIYRSLVYDVLEVDKNKITMDVPVDKDHPEKGTKKQIFDITPSDWFWQQTSSLPFPEAAEHVTSEWTRYQADADSILKKTGASSLDDIGAAHLKDALELLPELRDRRKIIEEHMAILEQVMEGIKTRSLDQFFQVEEDLMKLSKSQMLQLIKETHKDSQPSDRLRVFLQWYITTEEEVSRAELNNFTQALEAAGADIAAVKPIESARSITRMARISSTATPQPQSQIWSSLSSRVTDRFKEAGLGANFESVLSGVKGFLPKNSDTTLTKITEALMDPASANSSACQSVENYLYFDPRSANARGTLPPASQSRSTQANSVARGIEASFGQRRQGFSDAIVCVVGGGSMDEYNNLMEWSKRTSTGTSQKRKITYGSTMLVSPKEFLESDLAPLGREST